MTALNTAGTEDEIFIVVIKAVKGIIFRKGLPSKCVQHIFHLSTCLIPVLL
jgi:hypothetical protein